MVSARPYIGELSITVTGSAIARVLTYLRDEPSLLFKELVDLCGVDYPARERRFDVGPSPVGPRLEK